MGRRPTPKHTQFTESVATKLDPAFMGRFLAICKKDKRTQAFVAREAIQEYVERCEKGRVAA